MWGTCFSDAFMCFYNFWKIRTLFLTNVAAQRTYLKTCPDSEYDVCVSIEEEKDMGSSSAREYYCSHKEDESVHQIYVSGTLIEINGIL